MDTARLQLLLSLSRLGTMRAVADAHRMTTSTVSQQIAALAKDAGTPLVEPHGRRVRLTAAGRRLADHAVTILAAVDAARLDLDPAAEPAGTLRIGGFATGIRVSLLPALDVVSVSHPGVDVIISEYEPIEAFRMLVDDDLDLALAYDYNLAPASADAVLHMTPLWTAPWGLAVPASAGDRLDLGEYANGRWIVNSRNTADEDVVRTVAAMAGFTPDIAHQIDSLDLVEELILAGYGVGLLPLDRATRDGVKVLPINEFPVMMTAYAVTRRGRAQWPPLRLVLQRLRTASPAVLRCWPRSG